MDVAHSKNNVPIRLISDRWFHIVENHNDLAGYYDDIIITVEKPNMILRAYGSVLTAIRGTGRKRYLAVIYKEVSKDDGFIISAYFTSKINREAIIWPKKH